jgi:hypothetical protein
MSNTSELRRKILEGLIKRIEAQEQLGLDQLSDPELEQILEAAVRMRWEAGQLRRAIFAEKAARRLVGIADRQSPIPEEGR